MKSSCVFKENNDYTLCNFFFLPFSLTIFSEVFRMNEYQSFYHAFLATTGDDVPLVNCDIIRNWRQNVWEEHKFLEVLGGTPAHSAKFHSFNGIE